MIPKKRKSQKKRQVFRKKKLPQSKKHKRRKTQSRKTWTKARHRKKKSKKKIQRRRRGLMLKQTVHIIKMLGVLVLMAISLVAILIISKNIIIEIRKEEEITETTEKVTGFPHVIQYPDSEFIFKNHIDDEIVQELLQNGVSVYRLPPNHSIDDVFLFYENALPKLGWEKVLEVPWGTADKRGGRYWVREGKGLRIYSEIYDIWYQNVSEIEAHNGLANVVAMENARQLILSQANHIELLPDFPWRLQLSGEYTMRYNSVITSTKEDSNGEESVLSEVLFRRMDQDGIVTLFPIAQYTGGSLDSYLDRFVLQYNLEITDSVLINNRVGTCVEADLIAGEVDVDVEVMESSVELSTESVRQVRLGLSRKAVVMNNTNNNVVYVVLLQEGASEEIILLYEFIKENIEVAILTS